MTVWSNANKIEEAHECSYCGDATRATFILTDELFGVFKHLCKNVKTEWQALLIGEERDGNVVFMNDYYIPKQTVTSATVINDECFTVKRLKKMRIVGGIHSHGGMRPFFSTTDHDCTNTSPIKNNIVINNDNVFVATKAIILPCGMVKFLDADVTREMPAIEPVNKVRNVKHIEQSKYTYLTPSTTKFGGGMGAWARESDFDDHPHYSGWDKDYSRYGENFIKGTRKKHAFDFENEKGGKA